MAFSIKFTEGVLPGKKLQMLKRSAAEIYDASAAVVSHMFVDIDYSTWMEIVFNAYIVIIKNFIKIIKLFW